MSQPLTIPEKVVSLIDQTDAALKHADAIVAASEKRAASYKAAIPAAVDALIKHERIREDQRTKCAEALSDPAKALELLVKVAGHRNAAEMASLGTAIDAGTTKTAAAGRDPSGSLTSPFVGRQTTMVKQSDVNLFTRLGLPVPTE